MLNAMNGDVICSCVSMYEQNHQHTHLLYIRVCSCVCKAKPINNVKCGTALQHHQEIYRRGRMNEEGEGWLIWQRYHPIYIYLFISYILCVLAFTDFMFWKLWFLHIHIHNVHIYMKPYKNKCAGCSDYSHRIDFQIKAGI